MATTSFDQKFYVSSSNIDSFIDTITASTSTSNTCNSFESRAMTKDEFKTLVEKVSSTDD